MSDISLKIMNRDLCHLLYKEWQNDVSIYMDMSLYKPYVYDSNQVDKYFTSKTSSDRIMFAIMLDDKPIGELQLKKINILKKECTLSIHMQNDYVKGKGYGSLAIHLAIEYAFDELGMNVIKADAVTKNVRSQHVLEKVGFCFVEECNGFKYYEMKK